MKDHEIRELVNQLRDVAIKYHGAGQLREQIARVVRAHMLLAGTLTNEGTIQAGNSPVIPDGYVMVPKEPTPEILAVITEAIRAMRGSAATYARVLAAAPQPQNAPQNSPEIIPGGHAIVPVDLLSELRDWALPEIEKYCEMWEGRRDSEFPALRKVISDADALLAAAPQEVPDGK